MFEAASVLITKIIGFIVGIGMIFAGIFSADHQTKNTNRETPAFETTTSIAVEKNVPIETNQIQATDTVISKEKKKEKKLSQKELSQLEKLVEETNVLTKQFSALIQKEKKDIPLPIPFSELNQRIRPSIVNIFCTTKTEGALNPISGSGVVISKEGVVITNAHIGQYFLLKNYQTKNFISCVARYGDDNNRTFALDLVFISPVWVKVHAKDISKQNPTGTGQYDYALLSIGNPTNGSEKPQTFPFVPVETDEKNLVGNSAVLLAGYPAEFLSESFLQRELSLVSSVGEIQSIFTFSDTIPTIDLLGINGSIVSQKGSSGGAVVSQETGNLVGMITTSTAEKTTGERILRAISSAYINRTFEKETNTTLSEILAGNTESFKKAFAEQMLPSLVKQLEIELDKQ